jgi:hypothetical protein
VGILNLIIDDETQANIDQFTPFALRQFNDTANVVGPDGLGFAHNLSKAQTCACRT